MDEVNGEIGDDFSMNIAKFWERTFFETQTPKTLKTALRTSIVLGLNGGSFIPLKMLTKFGFGGKQGKGNQFISWIHEKDFARAIEFTAEKEISGIVNVVSPKPIANYEFMKTLRKFYWSFFWNFYKQIFAQNWFIYDQNRARIGFKK